MSHQFRVKGRIAKRSLADRINNLKPKSKCQVTQDLSNNDETPSPNDGNMCTPPTSLDKPTATDTSVTLTGEENSWQHGRRIIEIGHIAKQMTCTDCGSRLALQNIVHEVRYGLGAILMVECDCGAVVEVSTGKTHRVGKKGPPVFDVNTKAALGGRWYLNDAQWNITCTNDQLYGIP